MQPGHTVTVALRLEHAPHWHTYWVAPGVGLPTKLTWDLPPGWTAGDIQWPTPSKIMDNTGTTTGTGYTDIVYLPVTLTPPADLAAGTTVTLKAKAEWLMCDPQNCNPGEAQLSLTLPVAAGAPAPDTMYGAAIAATLAALPRASEAWQAEWTQLGDKMVLQLKSPTGASLPAPGTPWFFSDQEAVAVGQPQIFRETQPGVYNFVLSISQQTHPTVNRLTGVLRTEGSWAVEGSPLPGLRIDAPQRPTLPGVDASLPGENSGTDPGGGLAGTFGLALLGGLILNLMPCVFPVLGLKILGFVKQAGAERRKIMGHGLSFTAGVLLSFWVLAGALAVLRAGGAQLGWGFQLQSPAFVFSLAVGLLLFALNLSGVFEFGLSATAVGGGWQSRQGYTGSFFTGVLATVVATPCSAPFLATALGAALTLPTGISFLLFTTIGLGMSAPYLALAAYPGAVRLLPRPGAWMETFKQFMAFPLYATAGYLLWVLGGQISEGALLDTIFSLTSVAMAAWCYGRFAAPGSKPARARFGIAGGVALLALGAWLGWPRSPAADAITWEPWSTERVAQLHAAGRVIYMDFTARWCATCQANERVVFASAAVREEFHTRNIATLKADWTNRDAGIAAELAKWHRAAVPFNLVWLPGDPEPKPLPAVLSPGIVMEALGKK